MTLATDFRSASRNVRRGGWLSATVVLILAVAIGAVTAIFSIAHAVLIRPLPVVEPDRVMLLWGRDDARSQQVVEVSLLDQRAWLAGQKSFTAIELFGSVNWGELHVTGPGQPFRAVQNAVSSGFFDVLGARPMIGRTFRPADDLRGARPTVVLSADVWRQQFSSDPSVVGRLLTVGTGTKAVAFEVIGVMPPDFRIPAGAQVWIALGPALAAGAAEQGWQVDGVRAMYAIGRLAPGATVENAVAELSTIARNEELKNGMANTSMAVVATPLMTHLLGPARPALLAIAGASGALLLIACANAAALLLVHGAGRRREVAVRFALGARRLQIVRQLFCESIVLSLIAGVLGVGLAYVSFGAIVSLAPIEVPRLDEAAIDVRALLFALVLCLGTAVMVGLLPAWRHSGAAPFAGLHERSRSATAASSSARARKLLVAGAARGGGGAPDGCRTVHPQLHGASPSRPRLRSAGRADVQPRLLRGEARHEGEAVGAGRCRARQRTAAAGSHCRRRCVSAALRAMAPSAWTPTSSSRGSRSPPRASSRNPILNWEAATPDYFRAMDIRLLQGRLFDERDTAKSPLVVIVGQSLAARLWPGQDPIGRRMLAYGAPSRRKGSRSYGRRSSAWSKTPGIVKSKRRGSTCICRTARRRIRSSTSWCACRAIRLRRSRR